MEIDPAPVLVELERRKIQLGCRGRLIMTKVRLFGVFVILAVQLTGSACSGHSTAPSDSTVTLTISGLSSAFPGLGCTREFPGTRGAAGTTLFLTFSYTAPEGNLTGGHVQLLQSYRTGDSETHTFAIPSDFLTMTGTMSGTIRIGACPRYNDATGTTETVSLFDAGGHSSNALSVAVTRPVGAP
jgi:hypothetical protein